MKVMLFVVLSLATLALAADHQQEDEEKTLQKRGIVAVGYGHGPAYGYGHGPFFGYGYGPSYGHGYGPAFGHGYGHGPNFDHGYGHGVSFTKFVFPSPSLGHPGYHGYFH